MSTPKMSWFEIKLAHHPFEPIGLKGPEDHHHKYVKRVLEAKIARGELSEKVYTTNIMPSSQIFRERPNLTTLDIED